MNVDFSESGWGHALHGHTFAEKQADRKRDRAQDRRQGRRRYTVMVHSRQRIRPGDTITYPARCGLVTATVAAVAWCGNPPDMATIEILIAGETP